MNLLRALAAVSSLTLVSRTLGYVRDFFIARAFGAGLATDAFFVAFRIPNLLRRLFAEGAFSQAFVPVLAEYKNRQSPEETKTLVDGVATALFLALVIAALIGVLTAPLGSCSHRSSGRTRSESAKPRNAGALNVASP